MTLPGPPGGGTDACATWRDDDLVICKRSDCVWSTHAASLSYVSCPRHGYPAAYMSDGETKILRCHGDTEGRSCRTQVDYVFDSRNPSACPRCRKHQNGRR
jgi:hypothetical protein